MSFKTWLEFNDIFGFEKEQINFNQKYDEELPLIKFDASRAIELLSERNLNNNFPFSKFSNQVQWGNGAGSVKITISPMNDSFIHTLINDLEGQPTWICRKVFQIDTKNYGGREEIVSEDLFQEIKNINYENILYPQDNMDLISFVSKFANRLRQFKSEIFYYKGIKKISENNYNIWFEIKGQGTGRIAGSQSMNAVLQMITDVSFNPTSGLMKIMLTNVNDLSDSPTSWELWYSDFNELYSPKQNFDEIIESFLAYLKYY